MTEETDKDSMIFEEDQERPWHKETKDEESFIVALEGYEGPLDLLLSLAHEQKVDLAHISIITLVDQYTTFLERSKELKLVIAADYLVMAAWLAFLKSKLLLPQEETEEERSGESLAEALKFQLKRLEALRAKSKELFHRPRLNINFFGRGQPEGWLTSTRSIYQTNLYDLVTAYGDMSRRKEFSTFKPQIFNLLSMDEALERLENMLGEIDRQTWVSFNDFIEIRADEDPLHNRSQWASTFVASLEVAKQGKIKFKQDKAFGDLYLKAKEEKE